MKKFLNIIFLGTTFALTLVSCSEDDNVGGQNESAGKIEMTSSELATIEKCNNFGFKLLKVVNESNDFAGENVIISPASFNYAFSMLMNGANGDTRTQIIDALGYDSVDIDELNEMNRKLIEQLCRLDSKVTMSFANSMWAKADVLVNPDFISTLSVDYDAELWTIDDATFVADVNGWCSDKTNGKVSEFLKEGEDIPDFALFNALYFKGVWNQGCKFDSKYTREGVFNDAGGTRSMVKFMNNNKKLPYNESETMQKCELPFGNTSFSAAFILPKEGVTLSQAIDNLSNGEWDQLKESYPNITVDLSLPKYKIENEIDFEDLLADLGLEGIFSKDADFSNITPSNVKINCVKQKIIFEINEEGAEAASVTGITGAGSAMPQKVTMTFDRPFIYVVYEQSTGTILFAGCVNSFAN